MRTCKKCRKQFEIEGRLKNFCSASCLGKYARSKVKAYDGWSLKYDKCIECGTTEKEHSGKGLCTTCYSRTDQYRATWRRHYDKNKEHILAKSKDWAVKKDYWRKRYRENSAKIKENALKYHDENYFGGLREDVFIRDKYQCVRCDMTMQEHLDLFESSLNIHHIDRDRKNNVLENLETLCLRCHGREHTKDARKYKIPEVEYEYIKKGLKTRKQVAKEYGCSRSVVERRFNKWNTN